MKYKTEKEFCAETTKMLLGLSVGYERKLIAVPEVPWGCFSNEQFDMLLLDVKNLQYLQIEYKLNDPESLQHQVSRINGIGIINRETTPNEYSIYPYTGEDGQIENMDKRIFRYDHRWRSVYFGFGMIYYWAYKNQGSSFDGGRPGGGRQNFASVYMQAVQNFHAHYGKLDFMITHAALNSGYSVSTSKRYYRRAVQ